MITRSLLFLFILLLNGSGFTEAATSLIGASTEEPQLVCATYSQKEVVTLPGTTVTKALAADQGAGNILYIVYSDTNDTSLRMATQAPFQYIGPSTVISLANDPIQTSRLVYAVVGKGVKDGKLLVVYQAPAARCSVPGFDCIGIDVYNGITRESRTFVGPRTTNLYGITQDDSNLYALVSGDGTAGGTLYSAIQKIDKASLNLTNTVVLDTGNNTGGPLANPFYNASNNMIYAPDVNGNNVHRVDATAFTVAQTSVGLNSQGNGVTVAYSGTALADQLFVSTRTTNTLYRMDPTSLALNSSVAYSGTETSIDAGLYQDNPCNSMHMITGATAGSNSVQRFRLTDSTYQDAFSVAGYQNGNKSAFNYFTKRLFKDNGAQSITAISSGTFK